MSCIYYDKKLFILLQVTQCNDQRVVERGSEKTSRGAPTFPAEPQGRAVAVRELRPSVAASARSVASHASYTSQTPR